MRNFLVALFVLAAPPAFAECAPGYSLVPASVCQQNSVQAPVIDSALMAAGTVGTPFSYQILATNSPTSYGAAPLPSGLSVDTADGVISGTPTVAGSTNVTISATNSGSTGSATLVVVISNPAAPGFYVATNGSDSNAGTIAAPFATFGKCQSAMAGSGTKTCYVRGGSYTPAAGPACGSGSCVVALGTADNGETWSFYPPDGYNTADITGGSTASGNGLWAFANLGASNVTFNGLKIHNFDFGAVTSLGGVDSLIIKNSEIHHINFIVASGPQNAASVQCYHCTNFLFDHNNVHDIASFGVSNNGGGTSGMTYSNNYFQNTCTQIRDCGVLYTQDLSSPKSTNIKFINNYVRDGVTFSGTSGGWGAAPYMDDCASNVTISGNVFAGINGTNYEMIHGGSNDNFFNNLVDLAGTGAPILREQSSSCTASGNSFSRNIVISNGSGGGYNGTGGTVSVSNNFYHNYGGGTLSSSGDSSPVTGDPQLNCWAYNIASGSPVLSAPINFVPLVGGWGPPGFTISHTGTPPSSPHGC